MEHRILVDSEVELQPELAQRVIQVIETALQAERVLLPCEVNVLFTDNDGIQAVNREMRELNQPTDVLSFPMFDLEPGIPPEGEEYLDVETGLCPLGDMCISLERAETQAEEYGHTLERELCYLTVHSVLHLLGYDHLDEGVMKRQMREREEEILSQLGITRNPQ